MVRAILEGRKTQTRRVCKNQPPKMFDLSRYGEAGDRLWVRETWLHDCEHCHNPDCGLPNHIWYRASEAHPEDFTAKWKPSIFMPRWASRLMLKITDVRAEMLKEITDADALAEGVDRTNTSIPGYARTRFQELWDSINAKRGFSWQSNPFVWVIEFNLIGNPTLHEPDEEVELMTPELGNLPRSRP